LGRLLKSVRNGTALPLEWAYDVTGLISATKDTFTTYYTNDVLGRKIAERNPNGCFGYTYDSAGGKRGQTITLASRSGT
jgi:YD repeat-containing protein